MAPSTRPQYHLDLPSSVLTQSRSTNSTAASSPIESSSTRIWSSANTGSLGGLGLSGIGPGAGSPSHENGPKFYPRRARELQASAGVTHQAWGPPTASGLSTPLRETIPESPGDAGVDIFPDLGIPTPTMGLPGQSATARRARAGTMPSRIPPGSFMSAGQQPQAVRSSRATPTTSPYRSGNATPAEGGLSSLDPASATNSAFLSRFRAGSMPQRSPFATTHQPIGSGLLTTSWNQGRGRASTLSAALEDPISPSRQYRNDSLDAGRTLAFLGISDPSPQSATADTSGLDGFAAQIQETHLPSMPSMSSLYRLQNSRMRSFSVNAKETITGNEDMAQVFYDNGTMTLGADDALQKHNREVQAYVHHESHSRPRARTAGLIDSTSSRFRQSYAPTPARLDENTYKSDLQVDGHNDVYSLNEAVKGLHLPYQQAHPTNGTLFHGGPLEEEATRALWLGNVPASTTTSTLEVIFRPFGAVESARVLTHKNCGFVNYENVESATRARTTLNGKEIFPECGPIRIGFAKAPSASATPGSNGMFPSRSPVPFGQYQVESVAGHLPIGFAHPSSAPTELLPNINPPTKRNMQEEVLAIVREFGGSDEELADISAVVEQAFHFQAFETEIPPVPEPSNNRVHDAPRLREIRKRIDSSACTQAEIDVIAVDMLPEIAELASDYLGNTVVQKLFEFCSEPVKDAMLQNLGPRLAEIGVHKNGTWAAQKIIDTARTQTQMDIIADSLRPYGVASFLDQYGNYVMQCCLRFGAPWNNFIFEIMVNRMWDIAQGRFGARAMRASLESHHATKPQQKMAAAAVTLHSAQLATNANGALLLTWYLDTCPFTNRRKVLATRLVPHIVLLCTHKVAHLTVLKITNQRNELEARDLLLQAIFFSTNDESLTEILKDHACGVTLIFKIIATPFFDEATRSNIAQKVRDVLALIKAQPSQGYKRLMDEVGLNPRGPGSNNRDSSNSGRDRLDGSRPTSKHGTANGSVSLPPQATNGHVNGNYFPMMQTQPQQPYNPVGTYQPQQGGDIAVNAAYGSYTMANMNGMQQHYSMNSSMPVQASIHVPNHMPYQSGRPMNMYNMQPSAVHGFVGQSPQMAGPYQHNPRNQMAGLPQSYMGQPEYLQNAYPMMGMVGNAQQSWAQYPNYMLPQQQSQSQAAVSDGPRGKPF